VAASGPSAAFPVLAEKFSKLPFDNRPHCRRLDCLHYCVKPAILSALAGEFDFVFAVMEGRCRVGCQDSARPVICFSADPKEGHAI
jgi:hypothetical protein